MKVLVTGASSGIGKATAEELIRRGAHVIAVSRADLDVTDREAVDVLFDRCGPLDAVVHCAAVMAYGRFEDIPADVFDQVLKVNLVGTANVVRSALRHFGDHRGRVIVLGSLLGKVALPYSTPYVTSKWAVHGLTRSIQMERPDGVEISLISPGSIGTPIYRRAANYIGRQGRPIPPVHSPDRVARAIVRTLDKPRRDRSVGIANHAVVGLFRLLPMAYDALAGPVVRLGGLRRKPAEPSPGNAFAPIADDGPGSSELAGTERGESHAESRHE